MTPEQQISELRQQLETLQGVVDSMQNLNTVSPEFSKVLGVPSTSTVLSVSAKSTDSEDISINEAGSSTHDVLADPNGWLEVVVAGTTYYIPRYDSA